MKTGSSAIYRRETARQLPTWRGLGPPADSPAAFSGYTYAYGTGWRRSVVVSALASINVVNRHWARLVLGWMTTCGRVNHLGM